MRLEIAATAALLVGVLTGGATALARSVPQPQYQVVGDVVLVHQGQRYVSRPTYIGFFRGSAYLNQPGSDMVDGLTIDLGSTLMRTAQAFVPWETNAKLGLRPELLLSCSTQQGSMQLAWARGYGKIGRPVTETLHVSPWVAVPGKPRDGSMLTVLGSQPESNAQVQINAFVYVRWVKS